jgi:hypothetical protein
MEGMMHDAEELVLVGLHVPALLAFTGALLQQARLETAK